MRYYDKLVFELSKPGRCGFSLSKEWADAPLDLDASLLRAEAPALPEVSEVDVVRH